MAVKIKICGINNLEDALFSVKEGADALGFIFYPQSKRSVSPKEAKGIVKKLPCFVSKVGVFVDEPKEKVLKIADYVGLDTLQFHGKESPQYCKQFQKRFKVIKTFFTNTVRLPSLVSKYEVHGYLLDISLEEKEFYPQATLDFQLLKRLRPYFKLLILSGGLTPDNVGYLVKRFKPYAVDVARGVEREPGKKDKKLIRKFIKEVKSV
ncbi:MAG TPA: phosphoribosylanthranilate isomerase [Candidatus Omnitrophica bacterium]|nr:MAG: N-(5'-phosphoribosyl)anthranilate isomerase [Candidatus Omnitrophota bacterium]RKY43419.1 MAG: N-(5'-phosphoribosyl)anthranilate isomerase [Candidatus Omnitrophota bacterium]HEC68693.1 phosphoribosylanthranilate isomerase [Candidatus Omnitrophota bacterium]